MERYPRQVRAARLKCIECNAPVVETVEGRYACVGCGSEPVSANEQETTPRPTADD